jgi:MFS family permease
MSSSDTYRPPDTAPKLFYAYVIVTVTFIIMLLAWGLRIVYGVFFDPLLEQFGWSRAAISGAYSLSAIVSGVLGIAMGGLTDRFGPRVVVTCCGFCLGLGYLLMSQVNTIWQLYLYYGVVIGIGMGGLWIPLLSPIVRWFTGKRSLMTGIVASGMTIGQLTAPLVVSRLIAAYSWRLSFAILGGVVMVAIVALAQFLKRDPGRAGRPVMSTNKISRPGVPAADNDFTIGEALRTPQFWMAAAIFFCVGFTTVAVVVHIVPHAINLGIPAFTAANILAISGGMGIIGNLLLGGIIGDRIGDRKAFIIGAALMAASLFWLVPARQVWLLYLFAVFFGVGIGGTGTSESPLMARLFGLSSHGLIYGVVVLSWTFGGAVGPIVAGYLCDVSGSYRPAFLLCAAISVAGFVLLLMLRPTRKRGLAL